MLNNYSLRVRIQINTWATSKFVSPHWKFNTHPARLGVLARNEKLVLVNTNSVRLFQTSNSNYFKIHPGNQFLDSSTAKRVSCFPKFSLGPDQPGLDFKDPLEWREI